VQSGTGNLTIGSRTYDLGPMYDIVADVRVDTSRDGEANVVRLVPGADNTMIRRFGDSEHLSRPADRRHATLASRVGGPPRSAAEAGGREGTTRWANAVGLGEVPLCVCAS